MTKTKAEKAAVILANEKIEKANAFYEYHKEIIDKYNRLTKEALDAKHRVTMIQINYCLDNVSAKKKPLPPSKG